MRDDFSSHTKQSLQNRVASRCSNPDCRAVTAGPQVDPSKALNIGVAAHISAASDNGPRYDFSMTPEQRTSPENGIWLCQNCAKLIDNDSQRFTVELVHSWKLIAEDRAANEIGRPAAASEVVVGKSRPLVVVQYDCNLEETPEKPIVLQNVGDQPAFNITVSPIVFGKLRIEFEFVPQIQPDERVERRPDDPDQGLFFRFRIRPLLDKAWHETRWLPSTNLPKQEIEQLFDQPVVFPVTVAYRGPSGEQFTEHFELVYTYFAAHAFVRLPL